MFSRSKPACQILLGLAAFALIGLLWYMADIMLMLFGGLLWAIFLNKLTAIAQKHVNWGYRVTLSAVFIGILALFTLVGLIVAPQVSEQAQQFAIQLNQSWQEFEDYAAQFADQWSQFQAAIDWTEQLKNLPNVLRKATVWITAIGGGVFSAFVVLYVGTLIAFDPKPYKKGFLELIPPNRQKHIQTTLTELKNSLWRWLLGRFTSMLAVGILTWIGLMILDMPLAFLLALIAALLSFIPNIGIVIATSLALLIAFPMGWMMMLWVLLMYIIVQAIEGNLITPFIEQHLMSIPAGLIIISQIVFTFLFGFLGLMFATPLLVALIVLVKKLYVEEME